VGRKAAVIAIDTNLLVYAHRAGCGEHTAARGAIERAAANPGGWSIPLPCLLEFWSVVTHPACVGGASASSIARRFIDALISRAGALVLQPGPNFLQRCLQTAERLSVAGPRVFDLQIGLLCTDAGVTEIWTHDGGFIALPGLKVIDPLSASPPRKSRSRPRDS
jgi:predicted nucleic acid-binding protein